MGTEIDERVVEMRFNNSNFEKNAKKTESTLDRLEKKLRFKDADKGVKALETAFKDVKLNPLEKSIDVVNVKFKALELAGITALQNITNKAVDAGEKLIKSLSVDQVTEGFSKYEQKTAAVQTIMNATGKSIEEVSSSLEKLNWFTDETSYNFIDMVNNIGKFTSAGVDLDVAITAMEGIATEAALSGQGINEASRAMYNFAQAIGVGEVKLIDWKSIENANMATKEFKENIIDVALAEGTLVKNSKGIVTTLGGAEVSFQNFSENLKDGWFTSDVLIKSLSRYGEYADKVYDVTLEKGVLCAEAMELVSDGTESLGERAFRAAQEAKTFTDAINATKDAVSTGWMSSFEIIFGNYEKAKVLWTELANTLYEIFAEGGEARNELLGEALNSSSWEQFKSDLEDAGLSMEEFQNDLTKVAETHGVVVSDMIKEEGSFEAAIQHGGLSKFIAETLTQYTDGAETVVEVTEDMSDKVNEFNRLVNDIRIGKFGTGAERVKALTEAGYDASFVQSLVNKVIAGGTITVEDFGDAQTKTIKTTKVYSKELKELAKQAAQADSPLNDLINTMNKPTGRELLIDSFRNGLKAIIKGIEIVKESWNEIFPPATAERLYNIIEKFHSFTERLIVSDETAEKLKRTLKGVWAILDIIKQVIWSLTQNGLNIFRTLLNKTDIDVLEFTASIGDALVALDKWLAEGNKISSFLEGFINLLAGAIGAVKGWVDTFFEIPEVSQWLDGLSAAFEKLKAEFVKIGESMTDGTLDPLEALMEGFRVFRDTVLSYVTGIKFEGFDFSALFSSVDDATSTIGDKLSSVGSYLADLLGMIGHHILEFIKNLNPLIGVPIIFIGVIKVFDKMAETINTLADAIVPLKKISNSISSAITRMSMAASKAIKANIFLKIAGALAILAGSIWIFSTIDTEKFGQSMAAFLAASAGLVITFALLSGLSKYYPNVQQVSGLMFGLGGGIAILIGCLKLFETLKPNAVSRGLLLITLLSGILGTSVVVISRLGKEIKTSSIFIIIFAASLSILISSLQNLNKLNADDLSSKLGVMIIAIGGLIGIIFSASKIKISNGFGIFGIITSLYALMGLVQKISEFDPISIKENLLAFVEVFGTLGLIILMSSKLKEGLKGAGLNILALSAAIYILIPTIQKMSELTANDLNSITLAAAIISGLIIVMGITIKLAKDGNKYAIRSAAMIMLMSGAVAALAIVIWGLSLLDGDAVKNATLVVESMLVLMGGLIAVSKLTSDAMKSLITLDVMILLLGGIVIALTFMDTDSALKGAGSLAILFVALSTSMMVISHAKEISGNALISLIVLGVIAGLIQGLISQIPNEKDIESAIGQATALSELMLALSACVAILSKADMGNTKWKDLTKNWSSLGVLIAAMTGVAAVFNWIVKFDARTALAQSQVLTLTLLELTVIAGVLGMLYNSNSMASLGKTYLTLAVLTACMAAVAGVLYLIKDVDAGNAIKQIGALSLGVVALVGIATLLSALGPVISALVPMSLGILGGLVVTELIIVAVVGIFTLINWAWEKIAGLMGVNYNFSKALTDMGEGIGGFFGGIAAGFTNAMAQSDIEVLSGKMESFAGTIEVLGDAMSSVVNTMDVEKIKMIDNFAVALTKLAVAVTADAFTEVSVGGDTGYASLTTGLTGWVGALRTFGEEMKKLGDDSLITPINVGADITKKFAEVLKNIPNSGGIAAMFAGDNTWKNFGKGLKEYGTALADYSIEATKINHSSVEDSVTTAKALLEIYQNIPDTNGVKQFFTGDGTWVNFSTGLVDYGTALAGYAKAVTNLATGAISNSIKPSEDLIKVLEQIPAIKAQIGVFGGMKTEGVSWKTMGDNLAELGTAMVNFGNTMTSAQKSGALSAMSAIIPQMKTLAETLDIMDRFSTDHVYSVVHNYAEAFKLLNDEGLNITSVTINEEMLEKAFRIITRMTEIDGEVSSGESIWNWKKNRLKAFGDDLYEFSLSALYATQNLNDIDEEDFEKMAKYLILGFTNGIENGIPDAKKVTIEFTDAVDKTVRDEFGIHSPAKEWIKYALNCLKGFAVGLDSNLDIPLNSLDSVFTAIADSDLFQKLAPTFEGLGVDLQSTMGSLFGDFQGLNMDELSENFEVAFGGMQDKLKELTETFGEDSEQVKAYKKEMEGFKNQFSQFSSMYDSYSQTVEDLERTNAIKSWQEVWDNYKKGYITAAEYDKYYKHVLEVNSKYRVDIMKQASETMSDDITNALDGFKDELESTLSDAYSSISDFAESNSKTYSDVFKHTTYGDLYDKQMDSYSKETEKLNKELEKSKKLYGENSAQARWYAKEIERVEKEQEKWEESYEASGHEDDEIAATDVVDVFKEANKDLTRQKVLLDRLLEKRPDQSILDWLGGLDEEERIANLEALDKMTERELDDLSNSLAKNYDLNRRIGELLYGNKIADAEKIYMNDIQTYYDNLPTTAKPIGEEIIRNLVLGLSEEAEASLAKINSSGDNILNQLKLSLFGTDEVRPDDDKNIGAKLGNSWIDNFVGTVNSRAGEVQAALTNAMTPALEDIKSRAEASLATGMNALQALPSILGKNGGNLDGYSPRVVSIDGWSIIDKQNFRRLYYSDNPAYRQSAVQALERNNPELLPRYDQLQSSGPPQSGSTTYNQYIYTNGPVDRTGIYRDSQQLLQIPAYR